MIDIEDALPGSMTRYVTTEGLRLRASAGGAILEELTIGDPVTDLGPSTAPGWRRVDVGGREGVVFGKYLRDPLHSDIESLLRAAIDEWLRFKKGRADEDLEPYSTYVGEMWEAIGETYVGSSTYANGDDVPWSAAFISWVVRQGGTAYGRFRFSASHSVFVNNAIKARVLQKADKPFWGYRITEQKPELGDIIHRNRDGNNFSYSYAENHTRYNSHSDIVVEVTPDVVRVIGGNVNDTVQLGRSPQEYHLDAAGFIKPDQRVISVLKNRVALMTA